MLFPRRVQGLSCSPVRIITCIRIIIILYPTPVRRFRPTNIRAKRRFDGRLRVRYVSTADFFVRVRRKLRFSFFNKTTVLRRVQLFLTSYILSAESTRFLMLTPQYDYVLHVPRMCVPCLVDVQTNPFLEERRDGSKSRTLIKTFLIPHECVLYVCVSVLVLV